MSGFKDIAVYAKSRIEQLFYWSWCTFIACMVTSKGSPNLFRLFIALLTTVLTTYSTYIYNDTVDAEMDVFNPIKGKRPIASGKITKKNAKILFIVTGVLGLALSYMLNFNAFLANLIYYSLFTVYSYPGIRLKKYFIVKELVVASGFPLNSLVGNFAMTPNLNISAIFAGVLMGSFSFLGMPALQDSFDEKEDEIYGIKTMARAISWRRRIQMLGIAVLLMMTITPLTYINFGFTVVLPIIIVASSLVLLKYIIPIYGSFESAKVVNVRKITFIYVLLLQLSFILGSIHIQLL